MVLNKNWVLALTLGLLVLLTPLTLIAEVRADYVNIIPQGGALPVEMRKDLAVVRFSPAADKSQREEILREEWAVERSTPLRHFEEIDASLIRLRSDLAVVEVEEALTRLRNLDAVTMAAPVVGMVEGAGLFSLTDDRFYMSFESPVPEDQLLRQLEAHGVEVQRKRELRNIGRTGYWLRATEHAALHALGMSNSLYEQFREHETIRPVSAGPNFMPFYPILASSPCSPCAPDDPQYFPASVCPDATQGYRGHCNLKAIGVPEAWEISTGSPHVVVAVIDSGVDMNYGSGHAGHPDLNPNQWINQAEANGTTSVDDDGNGFIDDIWGWDFVDPLEDGDNIPADEGLFAHGTQSAGVIGAVTNNDTGVAGIAGGWGTANPGAKIMPLRAIGNDIDENGCVTSLVNLNYVRDAITYAYENGADVANLSLGHFEAPADLADEVQAARASGLTMIAANHNYDDYYSTVTYPAKFPEVIGVAALNRRENSSETVQRKFGSVTVQGDTFDATNPDNTVDPVYGNGPCLEFELECEGEGEEEECVCVCKEGMRLTGWGSNTGPESFVSAPGFEIYTTNRYSGSNDCPGEPYQASEDCYYNKTSSATAQVSAVAALLHSVSLEHENRTTLSPTEIQAILGFTADDMVYARLGWVNGLYVSVEVASAGKDIFTGWGRVNAPAAVALAAAPRFVIRDNAGNHLGAIDNAGNLTLEGRFNTLGSACNPLTVTNFASEFVIMSEDTVVAKLDTSGDFWTFGTLYTEVPSTVDLGNLPGSHILVQDSDGDEVAVIVSESFTNSILEPISPHEVKAGSLLLRGRYLSGSDPDGDGLFLETCN